MAVLIGRVIGAAIAWLYANVTGNLVASAIWATPALWHLHRKLDRQHAERLALTPGRTRRMRLLVDVEKDAALIEQRIADVLPEVETDALAVGRALATRWLGGGLAPTSLANALRQVAQEVEQQVLHS